MASGKSKSQENPKGKRRIVRGQEIAPRSARKKGKRLLSECTDKDLQYAQII